jgi:LysM repeat protein
MIHPAATLAAIEFHREAAARPPAEIVVRRGDSLSGIAARYRVEWPGLYEANRAVIGENPNLLNPGERLRIPSAASAARLAASYRPTLVPAVAPSSAPTETVAVQDAPAEPAASGGSFQGERRRRPGHERKWPLWPLPVQLLGLGRSGRQPCRLRECIRRRAEPGLRLGIRRGRDLTVGAVRRLLMRTPGHQATAGQN